MPTPEGAQLAQGIRRHADEFRKLCEGLDDAIAKSAPADRWSPKQIVSHLCGPEGSGFMPTFRAILDQDNPRLDIEVDNPFFTGKRTSMTISELLADFDNEYGRMADLVEGLTAEQLDRKVHIPILKETSLGEYTSLAGWIEALSEYHMVFHINHMKEILQELGAKP